MVIYDIFHFLLASHSLTHLLRAKYNEVSVNCLHYGWNSETQTWCRDVQILAHQEVKWVARTQLSDASRTFLKQFFNLDMHSPIGDFLFSCSSVKRLHFQLNVASYIPIDFQSKRNFYWKRETIWQLNEKYQIQLLEFF